MSKKKFVKPEIVRQEATVEEKKKDVADVYVTVDKKEAEKLQGKFVCTNITGGEGGKKEYTFKCSPEEAKDFLGGK